LQGCVLLDSRVHVVELEQRLDYVCQAFLAP
jgi:hypothetical protein